MVKKKRKYLTPKGVAKALGVSKMTVYRWIWEGRIKAYTTPGGRIRIPASELRKTRKRKTKR
jgi:putative resolvase